MRQVKIAKRNGTTRTICVPSAYIRRKQRSFIYDLHDLQKQVCNLDIVHGFIPGRSPVTNALAHVGYAWSISFDLADFFDTLKWGMVSKHFDDLDAILPGEAKRLFSYQGRLPQGFVSSPILANVAFSGYDRRIRLLFSDDDPVIYTRYADDLTFSGNGDGLSRLRFLSERLPEIIDPFRLNPAKTKIQFASQGRRIITGIGVEADGIFPTRKSLRRMRAARFNGNTPQADGLAEWHKLKEPRKEFSGTPAQVVGLAKVLSRS